LFTVDKVGLRFVMSHGDRIICDDMVFRVRSDGRVVFVQTLPDVSKSMPHKLMLMTGQVKGAGSNFYGTLAITDQHFMTGHEVNAKISVWQWDDKTNAYSRNSETRTFIGTYFRDSCASLLRHYPYFTDSPNEIFMVINHRSLYRLIVDLESPKKTKRFPIMFKHMTDRIIDYDILDKNTAVVLMTATIIVVDITTL